MQLSGNTILITGGTSGIGLAFADRFLKNGNTVIITGRRLDRLEAIKETYPDIIIKQSDVSDATQRESLAEWAIQNYPDVNILVNNAGIQLVADLTQPADLKRVHEEVEINFIAPVHLASLFAPHLASKGRATIVNVSSGLAFAPLAFMPIYCATKAALHSLTLSLRHQLKDTSVRVFEIIPPSVDTELGHDRREDKTQSHGGMDVNEFIDQAIAALQNDIFEAAIGQSVGLRAKREELFNVMNR